MNKAAAFLIVFVFIMEFFSSFIMENFSYQTKLVRQ